MGISKRHHYIPQFLIKKFADEDGKLWIYNKETSQFSAEKKTPKTVFFEMNRNSIEINGQLHDHMEQLYGALDDRLAKGLTSLLAEEQLTPERVADILILAATLKWRIPVNDDEFELLNKELSYEKLPITIRLKSGENDEDNTALNYLINSEIFKQSKRTIFPFLPFYLGNSLNERKLLEIHNNCYINSNPKIISILGDVPFIERGKPSVHEFGNIIFPITNNEIFIYSNTGSRQIKTVAFYLYKDMNIFHQSQKYVVCKDRPYLEQLIRIYEATLKSGKIDFLGDRIFDLI